MKNSSLNFKISGIIFIFVLACITVSGVGIMKVSAIHDNLEELLNRTVKRMAMTQTMDTLTKEIRNQEKVLILEDTPAGKERISWVIDELEKQVKSVFVDYKKIATPEGIKSIEKLDQILAQWRIINDEIRKHAKAENDKEATVLARGKSREILLEFDGVLEDILTRNRGMVSNKSQEAENLVKETRNLILMVSSLCILIGISLSVIVLRQVSRSISNVISILKESSGMVASGSQQIASSSEQLSQSSTEQAASLEETAASIEQMNSMVAKSSENAKSAASTTEKSQEKASQGRTVVEKMIHSMDEINKSNNNIMDQVSRSNESMTGIIKVIEEIGSKTKVINDIVFQTKLLSFNASVEAARAGEHGKGFAVVAEEVGNLARMSGNAAKEISDMLTDSIRNVNEIVESTKTGVEKFILEGKGTVETGTVVARECGEVLEEIVQNISSVSVMAEEISTASQEQARGVSEITKAMGQLDQMTQQNSAVSEECAAASEELSAQAEALRNAVNQLVITINGARAQTADMTETPAVALKPQKKAPVSNVVKLKFEKKQEPVLQRASNDTPSYSDSGFEEI